MDNIFLFFLCMFSFLLQKTHQRCPWEAQTATCSSLCNCLFSFVVLISLLGIRENLIRLRNLLKLFSFIWSLIRLVLQCQFPVSLFQFFLSSHWVGPPKLSSMWFLSPFTTGWSGRMGRSVQLPTAQVSASHQAFWEVLPSLQRSLTSLVLGLFLGVFFTCILCFSWCVYLFIGQNYTINPVQTS